MSKCRVNGEFCSDHGFIHGGEAEELREGIEKIVEESPASDDTAYALRKLLDRVDARDSLAFSSHQ